jgi:hypothetical protein
MAITDIRRHVQSQHAAGERAAAIGHRRGRHRRPGTWRSAWLAALPRRASVIEATPLPVACGAAIFGCVVLLLAGLVGVPSGDRRRTARRR